MVTVPVTYTNPLPPSKLILDRYSSWIGCPNRGSLLVLGVTDLGRLKGFWWRPAVLLLERRTSEAPGGSDSSGSIPWPSCLGLGTGVVSKVGGSLVGGSDIGVGVVLGAVKVSTKTILSESLSSSSTGRLLADWTTGLSPGGGRSVQGGSLAAAPSGMALSSDR